MQGLFSQQTISQTRVSPSASSEQPGPNSPSVAPTQAPADSWLFDPREVEGYAALTPKQRKFAEAILAGTPQREAALLAGVTEASADRYASETRRKPEVARFLAQGFVKAGSTPERNLSRIEEAAVFWHEKALNLPAGKEKSEAGRMAHSYASLLASIHGKLNLNLSVTAKVEHRHTLDPALQKNAEAMHLAVVGGRN